MTNEKAQFENYCDIFKKDVIEVKNITDKTELYIENFKPSGDTSEVHRLNPNSIELNPQQIPSNEITFKKLALWSWYFRILGGLVSSFGLYVIYSFFFTDNEITNFMLLVYSIFLVGGLFLIYKSFEQHVLTLNNNGISTNKNDFVSWNEILYAHFAVTNYQGSVSTKLIITTPTRKEKQIDISQVAITYFDLGPLIEVMMMKYKKN